jgi:putative LysE/RhtB family amino acid efflux pump
MSTVAVLFGKGAVLGLSIAAPVGPMALLCFRTTLARGFRVGVLAGLGVAAGDVFYASLAAFGLSAASALLTGRQGWLGLSTALRPWSPATPGAGSAGGLAAFATTFLLTLANPPTIMIFAAMFAGLGLAEAQGVGWPALAVVAGVLVGSGGWWLLFAGVVSLMRERVSGPLLAWVNRVSGAALAGFGAWAVAGAVRGLLWR